MIEVAAAIIENEQGQVLIARKREGTSNAGLWEFPGGKLEPKESPQDCLKRELWEEMQITIEPYAYFGTNDYTHGERTIRLIAWRSTYVQGTWTLTDHDKVQWVWLHELQQFDFAPADQWFIEQLSIEAGKQTDE